MTTLNQETPFLDKAFGKFPAARVPWIRPNKQSRFLSIFLTHHSSQDVSSKLLISKQMLCFDGIITHQRGWNEVNPIRVWGGLLERGSLQSWRDADALVGVREDGDGTAEPASFVDEMDVTHYEEIGKACSIDIVLEKW